MEWYRAAPEMHYAVRQKPFQRCFQNCLPMSHEFELIDWIRGRVTPHPRVDVGIGDDAAVMAAPFKPVQTLVTVDMLMEGVDFLLPDASGRRIGHKALAVNLSDIAAMAGRPVAAFVSVALPRRGGMQLAQEIQQGIQTLAAQFDVALPGGDTNTWDGPLVISIMVHGEPTGRGPVLRSGAKVGDWIMATGAFGGSIHGRHLDFVPRLNEAETLNKCVALNAMLDVSDGLVADLRHILEESHVGAVLDLDAVPISPDVSKGTDKRSPLEHALSDGEDFELLFTVSPAEGARLLASPPFSTRLTHLGEITAGGELLFRNVTGELQPAPVMGWKHGFQ